MAQPQSRLSDMCAHGNAIVSGSPDTIVTGMPEGGKGHVYSTRMEQAIRILGIGLCLVGLLLTITLIGAGRGGSIDPSRVLFVVLALLLFVGGGTNVVNQRGGG